MLLVQSPYYRIPVIDLANMGVRSSMSVVRIAVMLESSLLFLCQVLNEVSSRSSHLVACGDSWHAIRMGRLECAFLFLSGRCSDS